MKRPSFQFYPKDWLSSLDVRRMTAEQRGWYIQLLCEAWESEIQGTLPNDPELLWMLAGASSAKVFHKNSGLVLKKFEEKGEILFHHRLCEEIAKQKDNSEKRQKAGFASGVSRRQILKNEHIENANTCSTHVRGELNNKRTRSREQRAVSKEQQADSRDLSPTDYPF